LAGASFAQAGRPVKNWLLACWAVGDLGWSYEHDMGRKGMEEKHFG